VTSQLNSPSRFFIENGKALETHDKIPSCSIVSLYIPRSFGGRAFCSQARPSQATNASAMEPLVVAFADKPFLQEGQYSLHSSLGRLARRLLSQEYPKIRRDDGDRYLAVECLSDMS
jgi:hypothetical protein